jgi:hypothetical protein
MENASNRMRHKPETLPCLLAMISSFDNGFGTVLAGTPVGARQRCEESDTASEVAIPIGALFAQWQGFALWECRKSPPLPTPRLGDYVDSGLCLQQCSEPSTGRLVRLCSSMLALHMCDEWHKGMHNNAFKAK